MKKLVVAATLVGLLMSYLVWLYCISYDPYWQAIPVARAHVRDLGFKTSGYAGDIVDQPTLTGSCTVRIGFVDWTRRPAEKITVTLHRRWAFGGYRVVGHTIGELVDQPGDLTPGGEPASRRK
ncbi:MAG: hypothetical protein K2X87_28965 [Gemmataceae bacterium]|nr:hypothetical protein [Gemmataceae bacterium]